ncbi:hypothetical protein B4U80_12787 [Leptotrombidium deliense]|uniref:Uncharacterized protein n=1 Tax=Leptotrombidium deliense TaxID=299467 RepID=A0A443SLW1_9ACAR|nr:hypothetical protein B4U80_12787 [Leptotrombidium deliense]
MNVIIYTLTILLLYISDTHAVPDLRDKNANILLRQVCNNAQLHKVSAMTTAFDSVIVFSEKYVFLFGQYEERSLNMNLFLPLYDNYPKYIKDVFGVEEVTLASTDNSGSLNLKHGNSWSVCNFLQGDNSCKTFPESQIFSLISDRFYNLTEIYKGKILNFEVYAIFNHRSTINVNNSRFALTTCETREVMRKIYKGCHDFSVKFGGGSRPEINNITEEIAKTFQQHKEAIYFENSSILYSFLKEGSSSPFKRAFTITKDSKFFNSGYDLLFEDKRFFGCPTSLCNGQVIDALLRSPDGDIELFAGAWNSKWDLEKDIQIGAWKIEHRCDIWANIDAAFYDSNSQISYFFKDHYFLKCDKNNKTDIYLIDVLFASYLEMNAIVDAAVFTNVTSMFTRDVNAAVGSWSSMNNSMLVFAHSFVYVNNNSYLTSKELFTKIEMNKFMQCDRMRTNFLTTSTSAQYRVGVNTDISNLLPILLIIVLVVVICLMCFMVYKKRKRHRDSNRIPTKKVHEKDNESIVAKIGSLGKSIVIIPKVGSERKAARSHSSLTVKSGKTLFPGTHNKIHKSKLKANLK